MFCLSVVDMKGLEEIGRGFYIMKGKVGWKIFQDTRGRVKSVTSMLGVIWRERELRERERERVN